MKTSDPRRRDYVKKGFLFIECKSCGTQYNIGMETVPKSDDARREEWWAKHIERCEVKQRKRKEGKE